MKKERRKQIMRYFPVVLTAMTLSSCIPTVATIAIVESHRHGDGQKDNPNIIFVLADDLGYADLSCMGQNKFSTPNIDKLVTFTFNALGKYSPKAFSQPAINSL